MGQAESKRLKNKLMEEVISTNMTENEKKEVCKSIIDEWLDDGAAGNLMSDEMWISSIVKESIIEKVLESHDSTCYGDVESVKDDELSTGLSGAKCIEIKPRMMRCSTFKEFDIFKDKCEEFDVLESEQYTGTKPKESRKRYGNLNIKSEKKCEDRQSEKIDDIVQLYKAEMQRMREEYEHMIENQQRQIQQLAEEIDKLRFDDKCKRMEEDVKALSLRKHRYTLNDVQCLIPDLEVEGNQAVNVVDWIETVEDLIKTYQLDERLVMAAMRTKMKGLTINWFRSHVKGTTTWDEFKRLVTRDYKSKTSLFEKFSRMGQFKRKGSQSLVAFLTEMEAMAQGEVDEYELTKITMLNSENKQLREIALAGTRVSRTDLWQKMI